MFRQSDTRTIFKWIFSVPYLMKYCEYEKTTTHKFWDDYGHKHIKTFTHTAKGYKVRLINPIGILLLLTGLIIGFFTSIISGGLMELWKEIKNLPDYFTFL